MDSIIGKYCFLKNSKLIWKIISQNKSQVELQSFNKKIQTAISNIDIANDTFNNSNNNSNSSVTIKSVTIDNKNVINVNEIMLRHKTKLDALADLDKFIDSAVLLNLPQVKIIHGKNGGVIRKAVHEYLDSSPYILSYTLGDYYEGGLGVTIARLV